MNDGSSFSCMTYLILEQEEESFLKIYNDNKTVEPEKFHLDVENIL